MIPVYCTGGANLSAAFSDVVSVLELQEYLNTVELVTVTDSFVPGDPVLSFFDIVDVDMVYTISGADGLTGSPIDVVSVDEVYAVTVDGDIAFPQTQTANDSFVGFLT